MRLCQALRCTPLLSDDDGSQLDDGPAAGALDAEADEDEDELTLKLSESWPQLAYPLQAVHLRPPFR